MFNSQRYTFKGAIIFIFTLKEHKRIHLLKTVSLCVYTFRAVKLSVMTPVND